MQESIVSLALNIAPPNWTSRTTEAGEGRGCVTHHARGTRGVTRHCAEEMDDAESKAKHHEGSLMMQCEDAGSRKT